MAIKQGKGNRATLAGQLIAGARKHFANGSQVLTFAGGFANFTVDAAIAELQKIIDLRAVAAAARANAKDQVQAERDAAPKLVAFLDAFEALVRVMFGADTAALADFGLTPRKRPIPKTAQQKAVAAAKRKATRSARGTMGPKAKKAVHGNVTAQLVVTPVAPAPDTPKAPAAPAPVAPAGAPGGAATAPPKG
jgi:hypothetical protein